MVGYLSFTPHFNNHKYFLFKDNMLLKQLIRGNTHHISQYQYLKNFMSLKQS